MNSPFKKLNLAPREKVTKDDFGFVSESDEDEESSDEVADQMDELSKMFKKKDTTDNEKSSISENKYVKADMDYLSELVEGLEQQIKQDELEAKSNPRRSLRKSNNIFAKHEESNPEHDALSEKFAAFSKPLEESEPKQSEVFGDNIGK